MLETEKIYTNVDDIAWLTEDEKRKRSSSRRWT